jgi:flavin-dependent dehydrogenase
MAKTKVVIVGANVAGLNCALNLDTSKYSIIIIDKSKNPGEKVCAGGISSKADDLIPMKFYKKRFPSITVHYKKSKLCIDRKNNPLSTFDREAYIWELINQCRKKKIKVILDTEIKQCNLKEKYVYSGNDKMDYDILIGADGYDSIVRKYLGLKSEFINTIEAKTRKQYKKMHIMLDRSLGEGYFWIFPHVGYSSIGCGGIISNFRGICKRLGIEYYDAKGAKIQYSYKGYKFGDVFLIGEAAGFASAFTGEGVYYSIVSAIETAKELNTGKKSKKIRELAGKLQKHKHYNSKFKNLTIRYFLLNFFINTCLGRKTTEKICRWLSIK